MDTVTVRSGNSAASQRGRPRQPGPLAGPVRDVDDGGVAGHPDELADDVMPQVGGEVDVRLGRRGVRQVRIPGAPAHRHRAHASDPGRRRPGPRPPCRASGPRPSAAKARRVSASGSSPTRPLPTPALPSSGTSGRVPISPSASASASFTPSTATSALVCAAKCATPPVIIRCSSAPFAVSAATDCTGRNSSGWWVTSSPGADRDGLADRGPVRVDGQQHGADGRVRVAAGQADAGVPVRGGGFRIGTPHDVDDVTHSGHSAAPSAFAPCRSRRPRRWRRPSLPARGTMAR